MANGPVEIDAITRITELTGRVVEDAETVQLIDLSEAPFGDGQLDLLLKFPVCAA